MYRKAFTLLEILVAVVVLGIAAALVVPAMGQTGVLKVQGAVRTIISDITFMQSDAAAFQERRALVFDVANSSYRLVQVPGDTIDAESNTMYDPGNPTGLYVVDLRREQFGDARITAVDFGGETTLVFDALGGPVAAPDSNEPGPGGTIRVEGSGQVFIISVEPFTGRVTVRREVESAVNP